MSKLPTQQMKGRMIFVLTAMIILGFGTLIVRLFYLQIVMGEFYQGKANRQQMKSISISAKRGTIFDRNMNELAKSATVWTVFLAPNEINADQLNKIADNLSVILNIDRQVIIDKSKNKKSAYETLKKKIEQSVADEVDKFVLDNNITGVHKEEDNKRYYPYENFAATILGFTNDDNQGAYGIESYYNKILSGTPGMVVSAKNAWGSDMPFKYQQMYEAKDGNSIVLTIDQAIQHFLEKNLETAVIEHGIGKRATGIVMNVKTGEILAMSTKNDFDPNEPMKIYDPNAIAALEELDKDSDEYLQALGKSQFEQWRNKAITDPYEPGSVFKLITAAAAIESKTMTPTGVYFNCPGYYEIGGRRIHCWNRSGHGSLDFLGGLMRSCNPVFMMVGGRMGPDTFYKYFDAFGLTEPTDIDLPGEAGNDGLYHTLAALQRSDPSVELASSSFGQTFKITPIQLIIAVSATINGGNLMQPYVVKQVIDKDNNVISTTTPQVKRQVISKESSEIIASMAEQVVSGVGGSGVHSYIPGYRIGGKTGTSEKLDQIEDKNILSFYGFAPVDDPEIAVLVLLDEPEYGSSFGSVIAAPVVGAVLSDVLPYWGIEPHYTEQELEMIDVATPDVTGLKPHAAQSKITASNLKTRIIGSGTTVLKQIPAPQSPIPRGGTVILYTDEESQDRPIQVPNVIGLTGQQANKTIINAGLNIKIDGIALEGNNTVVKSQSVEAGTEVAQGTVIEVELIIADNIG